MPLRSLLHFRNQSFCMFSFQKTESPNQQQKKKKRLKEMKKEYAIVSTTDILKIATITKKRTMKHFKTWNDYSRKHKTKRSY